MDSNRVPSTHSALRNIREAYCVKSEAPVVAEFVGVFFNRCLDKLDMTRMKIAAVACGPFAMTSVGQ
ncbi:MAG: hypothetical protein GY774_37390 [Planctomycetes bacterium]|nr:hypothetical protein [Planctomycetota bacterium]